MSKSLSWCFACLALALSGCSSAPKYPHSDDPNYYPLFRYNQSAVFGDEARPGVYATVAIEEDRVRVTGVSLERPTGLAPGTREAIVIDPDTQQFALVFDANVPGSDYMGLAGKGFEPFATSVDCHGKDRDRPVLTPCSSHFSRNTQLWSYYFDPKQISALVSDAFDDQAYPSYQAARNEFVNRRSAAEAAAQAAAAERAQREQEALVRRCGVLMTQEGARAEARRLAERARQGCANQGIDAIPFPVGALHMLVGARSRDPGDRLDLPQEDCAGVRQEAARESDLFDRGVPWSQSATPYLYYLAATAACR